MTTQSATGRLCPTRTIKDTVDHKTGLVETRCSSWRTGCSKRPLTLEKEQFRGKRLPEYLRVIHYCLAALATLQFGCMPIADKIESISIAFVLFIFIGFNKSFQLGTDLLPGLTCEIK